MAAKSVWGAILPNNMYNFNSMLIFWKQNKLKVVHQI